MLATCWCALLIGGLPEDGPPQPMRGYQRPSTRASPRASGARNRSAPARIVAHVASDLATSDALAHKASLGLPQDDANATANGRRHARVPRYCALHRYDDRNCSTELLTENRNRRHIESYASSIKTSSTYSRQAYSVRAGRWEPSKGPKSWAYECATSGLPGLKFSRKCSWQERSNWVIVSNPAQTRCCCTGRFGTLAEAQMACELMARQSADSCTGVVKDGGLQCLGDIGRVDLDGMLPEGTTVWPRRLRAAVGVYGLLRSLCGVPLILAAIEPEDDLFAQLNYDSADHSRRAEASVALQQLAKRAVSFEVHDFRVTDQDEATSRCFDRAYAEQGDHYVGALLTGDRVRNHCRALALLFQLARAIETVEAAGSFRYDVVVVGRIDILYRRPIMTQIPRLEHAVTVPFLQSWAGFNDRIIAGARDGVLQLLRRLNLVDRFLDTQRFFLHPEPFLAWSAMTYKTAIITSDLYGYVRLVRGSGDITDANSPNTSMCELDTAATCDRVKHVLSDSRALKRLRDCGFNAAASQRALTATAAAAAAAVIH